MRLRGFLLATTLLLLPRPGLAQESVVMERTDAWGARRSIGLAVGETALVNAVVWSFNEFIRGGNFTQVNPRTWWTNISNGFYFDDNQFNTNFSAHPYHGSLYYNAGRSNGLTYWESAPFAIMGSFFWECCGETHPPAWNDWVSTGIGGIAIGEVLYRASSSILDNEVQGWGRTGREIGAFVLDPVRGFNRVVSGRSGRVQPNPTDSQDRIPDHLQNHLRVGYRYVSSEVTAGDSKVNEDYGAAFVEFEMQFGNPFRDTRRKPFDQFRMSAALNFKESTAIGEFHIVGNLLTSDLKKSDKVHHLFAVTQNFDYTNNSVIQFGGQSFGAGLLSDWRLSNTMSIRSDVNLHGYLLNSINSEYAFGAAIPDRERLREYDMGAGAGAWLGLGLVRKNQELLGVEYRLAWVHTLNGSNVNGADTNHLVQSGLVRAAVPVFRRWGIGADARGWLRDSYFSQIGFGDISQKAGIVRVYGWLRTF